jgi:putative transcription factor
MQCETCGRIFKEGRKVKLEGSVIMTCVDCSKYGEVIGVVKPKEKVKKQVAPQVPESKRFAPSPQAAEALIVETEALKEGYNDLIRKAREKAGMKQEDLARRLNEPTSLVHRLESGKYDPSDALIRRVQSTLGIKLFEKTNALNSQVLGSHGSKDLTLGDVVVVKKRDKQ